LRSGVQAIDELGAAALGAPYADAASARGRLALSATQVRAALRGADAGGSPTLQPARPPSPPTPRRAEAYASPARGSAIETQGHTCQPQGDTQEARAHPAASERASERTKRDRQNETGHLLARAAGFMFCGWWT
jgi:hypothetical protein